MWMANTHHLIIIFLSIYNLTRPACPDPYPFKALEDDLCWLTVDKRMVYCLLLTGAFMLAELTIGEVYIRDNSELAN